MKFPWLFFPCFLYLPWFGFLNKSWVDFRNFLDENNGIIYWLTSFLIFVFFYIRYYWIYPSYIFAAFRNSWSKVRIWNIWLQHIRRAVDLQNKSSSFRYTQNSGLGQFFSVSLLSLTQKPGPSLVVDIQVKSCINKLITSIIRLNGAQTLWVHSSFFTIILQPWTNFSHACIAFCNTIFTFLFLHMHNFINILSCSLSACREKHITES